MVDKNNDVEVHRKEYEVHALTYLKQRYPSVDIELRGHTRPGRETRDILIPVDGDMDPLTVEVKGSQLVDISGPRWQRVKLTKKDYAPGAEANYYLFVFNPSQLGAMISICGVCYKPTCNMHYRFISAEKVHSLVKNKSAENTSLSLLKIMQLEVETN